MMNFSGANKYMIIYIYMIIISDYKKECETREMTFLINHDLNNIL